MWNVIKAQAYQLMRDKLAWGGFLFAILINGLLSILNIDEIESGSEFAIGMGSVSVLLGMMVLLIIVANVMAKDFTDKTLNYEILSGHSRWEVFFGRFLVAMVAGVMAGFFVLIFMPCVITMIFGWGDLMDLQGFVIRCGLVFVTMMSVVSQVAFVAVLTKNPYITVVVGYLFSCVQILLGALGHEFTELSAASETPLLSVGFCFNKLFVFDDWYTFFLNEQEQIFYESAVEPQLIIATIGTAVITLVALAVLSYVFFKHDDLN